MEQKNMDAFQLFCLIVVFEIGSTILDNIGTRANQDAWIAIILSSVIGTILFVLYIYLYKLNPQKSIYTMTEKAFGRYIGRFINLLYVIYFLYLAARVLRDFECILRVASYRSTTITTLGATMIITLIYGMFKGIPTFLKFVTLIFFSTITISIFMFITILFSDIMNVSNLSPVLPDGMKPVFKEVFPKMVTTPYGELISLMVLFPFLSKRKTLAKGAFTGIFSGMVLLLIFSIISISVSGREILKLLPFPTFSSLILINIGSFINRIDPIVLVWMTAIGSVKIYLFFYCAINGAKEVFKLEDEKMMIYPIGILIIIFSVIMAVNQASHMAQGFMVVPYYLHIPFQLIIPLLLAVIFTLRVQRVKQETTE